MTDIDKITIQCPSISKIGDKYYAQDDQLVIGQCLAPSGPVQIGVMSISHANVTPVPKQRANQVSDTGRIELQLTIELVYPQELAFGQDMQVYKTGSVFMSLEQLLRQIELTPFIPIYNSDISRLISDGLQDYVWFAVQSVRVQSIQEQPGSVQIQLQLLKTSVEQLAGGIVMFKDTLDGKVYTIKGRMYESEYIKNIIKDMLSDEKELPKNDVLSIDWNEVINTIKSRVQQQFSVLQTLAPTEGKQQIADIWNNYQQQTQTIEKTVKEIGQQYDMGTVIEFEAQYQNYLQPHSLISKPNLFHQYLGSTGWQVRVQTVCNNYDNISKMQRFREAVGELVIVANDLIYNVPVRLHSRIQNLLNMQIPFLTTVDVSSVDDQVNSYIVTMQLLDTTKLYELEKLIDVSMNAQQNLLTKSQKNREYLFEDLSIPTVDTSQSRLSDIQNVVGTPTKQELDQLLDKYMRAIARLTNEKLATIQLAGQLLDLSLFDNTEYFKPDMLATAQTRYAMLHRKLKQSYDTKTVEAVVSQLEKRDQIDRIAMQAVVAVELGCCRTTPADLHALSDGDITAQSFSAQVQHMYSIRDQIGTSTFDGIFSYTLRSDLQQIVRDLAVQSRDELTSRENDSTILGGVGQIIRRSTDSSSLLKYIKDKMVIYHSISQDQLNIGGALGGSRTSSNMPSQQNLYHQQYCCYSKLVDQVQSDVQNQYYVTVLMVDDVDSLQTLPKLSRFGRWLDGQVHFISCLIEMLLQFSTDEIQQLLQSVGIDVKQYSTIPFQLDYSLSDIFTVAHPDRFTWIYDLIEKQLNMHNTVKQAIRTSFPGKIDEILSQTRELRIAKALQLMDFEQGGSIINEVIQQKYLNEPVATDIDTVTNVPVDVDLEKFNNWLETVKGYDFDTQQNKLGIQPVLNELNQSLAIGSSAMMFKNVLAINSADYSSSILFEQMYNLLTTSYDIDYLTPNAQVLFIYRHDIQPIFYPQSTQVITYNSIQQLSIVKQKDNPVHVADLLLTNMTGVIDPANIQLAVYRKTDQVPNSIQRLFITTGVEIAIRLGYGRNISRMPIVFQGFIQAVQQTNNAVHIIAEGYGALLTRQIFEKRKRIGGLASNPIELVYQALNKTQATQFGLKGLIENIVANVMQLKLDDMLATSYVNKRLLPLLRTTDQVVNIYQPTEYYNGYGKSSYGVFKNFETYFCEYNAKPGDSQWKLIQDQVDMMPGYITGFVDYGIGQQRVFFGRPFDPAKFTPTPFTEQQLSQLQKSVESVSQLELQDIKETIKRILTECKELPLLPGTREHSEQEKLEIAHWFEDQLTRMKNEYNFASQILAQFKNSELESVLEQLNPKNIPFFSWDVNEPSKLRIIDMLRESAQDYTKQYLFQEYVYQLRKIQEFADCYKDKLLASTRAQQIIENTKIQIDQTARSATEYALFTRLSKSAQYRDIYNRAIILGTKPYQSIVPVSSEINLIDNSITLTTRDIANEVILYSPPFFQDWFFLIRFGQWIANALSGFQGITKYNGKNYTVTTITVDDDIPDEYKIQKVEIVDYAEVLQQKVLVGTSKLMKHLQTMYDGNLTMLGYQLLKPHDRIVLNDSVNNMQGWQVVRDVIHRYDQQVGFITQFSIEPEIEVRDLHVSSLKQLLTRTIMVATGLLPVIVWVFSAPIGQVVTAFQLSMSLQPLFSSLLQKYVPISPSFKAVDSESSSQQISLSRVVNPIFVKPIVKSGIIYSAGLEGSKFNEQAIGVSGLINDARTGIKYFTEGLKQFGQQFQEGLAILEGQIDIALKDLESGM